MHRRVWIVFSIGSISLIGSALLTACSSGTSSSSTIGTTPTSSIAAKMVYGYNPNGNVVQTLSATTSGTVSPLSTVSVAGQGQVESVATGSNGKLYVGEDANGSTAATVFVLQAAGVTTPSPQGSFTVSGHPQALAVDTSGQVYVGSLNGSAHVYVYPANSTGVGIATRTINVSNVTYISDLAVDTAGNLYVAGNILTSGLSLPTTYSGVIDIYSATATDNAIPLRVITSSQQVTGIAVDSAGVIYANENVPYGFNLVSFAAAASGAATPTATLNLASGLTAPFYSNQIRLDANGNLFALVQTVMGGYLYANYSVFPTPLTGTTKPIETFNTPTTFPSQTGLAVE